MTRKVGYGTSTDPKAAKPAPEPAPRDPRFPRRAVLWALVFTLAGLLSLYLAYGQIFGGRIETFALYAIAGVGLLVTGISRLLKLALGLSADGGPRREP